ncbi:unnamed protein product [Calypogeia fissa]
MGSRKRIIKLQQKVLQAAALGSVKLLRTLLHSHARPLHKKEHKKSRKRGREDDHKSSAREYNRQKKRARKAEQREIRRKGNDRKPKDLKEGVNFDTESEDSVLRTEEDVGHSQHARHREERETGRRGSDRKRKEVGEGENLDEESEDFNTRQGLGFGHSKRARGEEQSEKAASGKHEDPSSEGGQTNKDGFSSPSNDGGSSGKESHDGSGTEEISPRQAGRKHDASAGETVRSIVNCRDAEGLTPLHHACHAGSEDLVKYLISKGASVHARDSKGNTPLHIAAKLGPASIVTILKDADADLDAFNDQGITPSDILGEKESVARRREMMSNQQKWYTHVAEELSDNEDAWWGTEWGEDERPDWEDPILERMAESRQGRGLYNEPFSLRDFLKAEKNKTQSDQGRKSNRRGRHTARPSKDDNRKSPEEVVIGPTLKVPVPAMQSYSQRWKTFSESYNLCLSYSSVPFPVEEGKEDTLKEVLLHGINPSMHRTALRKEMLRWHPDKFLQKWEVKLQGPDHDRIVARVNGISEAIHQLYKNLK